MRVIFLDRDGVINEDFGYVGSVKDFKFIDGVFEALREFLDMGYKLVVVTNQSGIGRGYYTLEDFNEVTEHMKSELEKRGIELLEVFYCPHHPDRGCGCRKPEPGMIEEAVKRYGIDTKNSWMIGDKPSDIEAAKSAGVGNTVLLKKKTLFDTIGIIKNRRGDYEI